MSIKNAADLVRAQGRYGDSQLMHVTPKEVQALQTIAQAHGKSLSVNPNTGLPEAFDLGAILPTVAGTVAGSMMGMPWLGAAIGGLGTYATTGSLQKGLMAGLGAFGGASLGSALSNIGAETALTTAEGAAGALGVPATEVSIGPGSQAAMLAEQASGFGQAGLENIASSAGYAAGATPVVPSAGANLGAGIQQLFSKPSETWAAMGGLKGQGMNLGMMAAPLLGGAFNSTSTSSNDTEPQGNIRQYDYDPIGRRFAARPVVSARDFQGFQPSVFGYAEGGATTPTGGDPIRAQIAKFYRSYLNREPDTAGLDYWANEVKAGAPMDSVLNNIKLSEEAKGLQSSRGAEDYYRDYLGRSPNAEELAGVQQAIQTGTPMSQIQQNIRQSDEAAGIAAAAQQRQQMFSPLPPTGPMVGQTPVQEVGASMIPNRYQAPVNIPSQGVQDYNQLLANRANYEYTQMPMLQAMRPRTPAEQAATRDRLLLGQQARISNMMSAAKPAMQEQTLPAQQNPYQNPYQDSGGGNSEGNASGGNADGGPGAGSDAGGNYAGGGITSIPRFQAGGEMESDAFVVPADVVSALGNGSTKAGVEILNQYLGTAMPIEGEGDGLSDGIPATIDGDQAARVADGEVYIPAGIVEKLGQGDPERGAAKLYAMMDKIRDAAHGKTKQQAEVKPEQVMPA